jgi:hypothetical protein
MFRTAQALDSRDIPYSWGGGHGTPARPSRGIKSDGKDGTGIVGLDCSSSVSAVLQSAYPGFPTITSGEFPRQSIMEPGRGLVTVWSNNKHVFMSFGTEDWGTNSGEPGNGPGFHNHSKGGYKATYPKGLGPKSSEPGLFGRVYGSLRGRDANQIDVLEYEFAALGKSARRYSPIGGESLMSRAADSAIRQGLAPFQQFAVGGTVPGAPGTPYPAIVHGGEEIIPEPTARRMRKSNFINDFLKDLIADIGKISTPLREAITDSLRKAFSSNQEFTRGFNNILKRLGIATTQTAGKETKDDKSDDRFGFKRGSGLLTSVDNIVGAKGKRFNIL